MEVHLWKRQRWVHRLAAWALLPAVGAGAQTPSQVKVWEQDVVIPTYQVGPPEPNPMFFFGRASQGAEGRVYPYPLYDVLTHRKVDRSYRLVYLENEYLRIAVLPEIGGRIFEGVDKTNNYHFFYRQHVIKPALIGLIGAWISGGVEWNIPHHHRATTFLPVQYKIESNADGSRTVWVGELELRHRMRWAVGHTLYPGKAYLETSVRIVNRTPLVHTLLCFANAAVHVNDTYQVIFPPRTQYGTHHHKREFTTWPLAAGRYGGWDFAPGTDLSWYKNHIASNSIFAWNYQDDFLAGYDHGRQAGTLAVANHHIVPGKKLWTWGNGPRGRMWDRILTDEDGPYIELMVGAYSDNQPDYNWLQPFETKWFEIFWYPFRDIGGVKNANREGAVNLEVSPEGLAHLGFYATSEHRAATVTVELGDRVLLREPVLIGPTRPYRKPISLPAGADPHQLRVALAAEGRELIAYSPMRTEPQPMPKPVQPPPAPTAIQTNEELYLTGLRIEQFHHPSLEPDPYWEEALRRDPGDVRVNTALGILYLKRARFADAERRLRQALERLTDRYTTPKDAEPFYYLGLALRAQDKTQEAFDTFYKATWSAPWREAAYYQLAEIATERGRMAEALELIERCLEANARNLRAWTLKAALLRHMGRTQEALEAAAAALRRCDPLDVRAMTERWLASADPAAEREFLRAMQQHPATALETAAEYLNAGLWEDGHKVLAQLAAAAPRPARLSPLVYYYLGYFAERTGRHAEARNYRRLAAQLPPDYVFPFQQETIPVLTRAFQVDPQDARAAYYLGNLLFDWQPQEAVKWWEASARLDPAFPIVHRNLALAYAFRGNDLSRAIASLETAVAQERKYPLHFAELDRFYEAAGVAPEKRLALLERNHEIVMQRDDALAREVSLKVALGKYDEAIALMKSRRFSVWEGGSLNIAEDWADAHLLRGRRHLEAGRYREALADFQAAAAVPENLPSEGRTAGGRQIEAAYWTGQLYQALGDPGRAREAWERAAASGPRRVSPALWSGEAQQYYRGLALRRLGREEQARAVFAQLIETGNRALEQGQKTDFFASFELEQQTRRRLADAHYLIGLGQLGLGRRQQARDAFRRTLEISPDHLGARNALAEIQ